MVQRWRITSLDGTESWTMPRNPSEMTSPWPTKGLTVRPTTAKDGQTLLFASRATPTEWQFSGTLVTQEHYDALFYWYNRDLRCYVYDHYDRRLRCFLTNFNAVPARSVNHPWRHTYSVNAYVFDVAGAEVL